MFSTRSFAKTDYSDTLLAQLGPPRATDTAIRDSLPSPARPRGRLLLKAGGYREAGIGEALTADFDHLRGHLPPADRICALDRHAAETLNRHRADGEHLPRVGGYHLL